MTQDILKFLQPAKSISVEGPCLCEQKKSLFDVQANHTQQSSEAIQGRVSIAITMTAV